MRSSRFGLAARSFSSSTAAGTTASPRLFDKILIANRGEIACRVQRTAKRLGIRTVAVYSEADANAMHVQMADEAVLLGPPPAARSYLLGDRILKLAKQTGAQAIHPGYGFLSENSKFAVACENAGVTFIGPPASAIDAMGSKSESKNLMAAAGVPCVPGYHGENQDEKFLYEKAKEIGTPLLIKAVLGGGGKGMKRVNHLDEFAEQLASAKREAMSSFGDSVVLLEKYITRPRHIELQVFGDRHGQCVHLFERDCSIQRRYQKVLEESPAPGLTPEMRSRMGMSAVAAAKAVQYVGAGTVEFIFDRDSDKYYFMEMNTRLQVEHPVTEMVTGQDLVEWQLRVAAGYKLPMTQAQLDAMGPRGHAFEARVYAEDPNKGFIPQTGTIRHLRVPTGDGVRVDTGIRQGDSVTPFYDPMIAKLIVWDTNRTEALRRLHRALESYEIVGVNNNIPFLHRCSSHPAFREGDLDTGFIPKYHNELFPSASDAGAKKEENFRGQTLAAFVAAVAKASAVHDAVLPAGSPFAALAGFRVNAQKNETPSFSVFLRPHGAGEDAPSTEVAVTVLARDTYRLRLPNGTEHIAHGSRDATTGRLTGTVDGNAVNFSAYFEEGRLVNVWSGEHSWAFDIVAPAWAAGEHATQGKGSLLAPMPGRITRVLVKVGQTVKQGEVILAMESMKMETLVRAPHDGIVKSIAFGVGELCEGSAVLCVLEQPEKK